MTTMFGIVLDTAFYSPTFRLRDVFQTPVITPLNNVMYNMSIDNLALHGLHPYYQHIVANLPQLLGPAYLLMIFSCRYNILFASAVSGIVVLSLFQHQEARFLIPVVPLVLASVRIPRRLRKLWIWSWVAFNVTYGIIMGMYHQGGVVPAQLFLAGREDATQALWWKTYSPPIWLLDGKNEQLHTNDLMGINPEQMLQKLAIAAPCQRSGTAYKGNSSSTYLIAPHSATFLDQYTSSGPDYLSTLRFEKAWSYKLHLNFDDLDIPNDGFMATIKRVLGRRGIVAWKVTKTC
jgi:phosphatidylinositol glycan class Z